MNDPNPAGDLGRESDQAVGPDMSLGGDEDLVILPFQFVDPGLDGLGFRARRSFFRLFDGEFGVSDDPCRQQDNRQDNTYHDPEDPGPWTLLGSPGWWGWVVGWCHCDVWWILQVDPYSNGKGLQGRKAFSRPVKH